ncbi:hypothetical protein CBR_g34828 [Chara braunii]|uniref:Reverse transcriptase domain-containing protein n=1 Tax=Chara braunii TaxID=69332 RepID=A0A388LJM4_CHABU|nr:hypothetical protein CBR_g34828 [Chara braunii]|eukprot:GBG82451.1 hypothetical protein CBR_g34828 [Chara braunii]
MLDLYVLIYLDDILVYNRSLDEHVEHLCTVLERLRQAKYKANRDKCIFTRQELEYLGHYVMPQGICPLVDKIEALQVWPEPTNTTNVRSFMGLAGYYQLFITGYSRIATPMVRLQSPKVPFVFDDDARQSFQALKTAMLMVPVLSMYDPTLPTRVTMVASGYGIGAVLEQHDGDDRHPVEYFSHKVPPINSLDDARKKELLAFIMALKRWRHFLLGRRRFTWVTDNNPLTYYKTQDTLSSDHPPASHYRIVDGYLLLHSWGKDLLCVPRDRRLQTCLLGEYHDSRLAGHFGVNRTIARLQQRFRWPDLITDITRYCDSCEVCRRSKPRNRNPYGELRPMPIPQEPGLSIAMDVTGPFPRDRLRHDGILTVVDRLIDIDAPCSPASVRKYRELLAEARANMQKAQIRMSQQANRRRVPCPIRAGDLVWVSAEEFALEQDVSRKLLPKWFGPWPVTAAVGDEPDGPSFVINIPTHLTVHPVFHASKLATYTPAKSDDFPGRRSQDPPSMDGHQQVDRVITDRKYGNKQRQYKVTLRACDPDDTRWISGTNLKASAPLIYAHYERQRLAQGSSQPAPPTRTVVPPSDRQLRPRTARRDPVPATIAMSFATEQVIAARLLTLRGRISVIQQVQRPHLYANLLRFAVRSLLQHGGNPRGGGDPIRGGGHYARSGRDLNLSTTTPSRDLPRHRRHRLQGGHQGDSLGDSSRHLSDSARLGRGSAHGVDDTPCSSGRYRLARTRQRLSSLLIPQVAGDRTPEASSLRVAPMSRCRPSYFGLPSSIPTLWQSAPAPTLSYRIKETNAPLLNEEKWDAWWEDYIELVFCLLEIEFRWSESAPFREGPEHPEDSVEYLIIQAWRTAKEGDLLGIVFGKVEEGGLALITSELLVFLTQLVDDLHLDILSRCNEQPDTHVLTPTLDPHLVWSTCTEMDEDNYLYPSQALYLEIHVTDLTFWDPIARRNVAQNEEIGEAGKNKKKKKSYRVRDGTTPTTS